MSSDVKVKDKTISLYEQMGKCYPFVFTGAEGEFKHVFEMASKQFKEKAMSWYKI